MANTYSQIYVHIVFSIKNRMNIVKKETKENIQNFVTKILQDTGNRVIALNIMPDHMHVFIGLNPDISVSDLVKDIKAQSAKFIDEQSIMDGGFQWREGYGAFTHSHSQIQTVIKYIQNQESKHRKKSFKLEYMEMLEKFNIKYDLKYVFDEDDL